MGEESACVWDRGLLSRMYKELKKMKYQERNQTPQWISGVMKWTGSTQNGKH